MLACVLDDELDDELAYVLGNCIRNEYVSSCYIKTSFKVVSVPDSYVIRMPFILTYRVGRLVGLLVGRLRN